MQIGLVVGHATATVKHPTLAGWRLLVVQPLAADGTVDGEPLLAIDNLGAGTDDLVILAGSRAAGFEVKMRETPLSWLVLGICD